jgi:transposase
MPEFYAQMWGGGFGFGERRQNGRPIGRLDGRWGFPAGSDRWSEWSAAAHEGGAGADSGGEHDARGDGRGYCAQARHDALADYDWRKQLRKGNLVLPESVASLPVFAELVVDDSSAEAAASVTRSDLEIVVGDVVIRAGADADEGQLTRAIRAARAAAS